jgi:hypothetical protein
MTLYVSLWRRLALALALVGLGQGFASLACSASQRWTTLGVGLSHSFRGIRFPTYPRPAEMSA